MKIEWLNESFTRAFITRRVWPRFWKKESTVVCYQPFGGFCYWFYEDFKDAGLEGMVEGHCDTGSVPEHTWFCLPYFSLARKLHSAEQLENYLRRESRKRNSIKQLESARAEKNPWKNTNALPMMKVINKYPSIAMTPSQYVFDMMPKKVPWWRPIERYRRTKIVSVLKDITLCPVCAITIPSRYALPCRIHQNEFERDVAITMIQFDRLRKDGYYVDQAKIDELEKRLK